MRHENTTQHTNGVVHCLHLSVVAISFLLLHISGATAQINPGYFGTWVNTTTKSFVQIKHEADSIYTIVRQANGIYIIKTNTGQVGKFVKE